MKIAFHESYVQPLPEGHRFPMEKYELLPKQLLLEGIVTEDQFFEPSIIDIEWIQKVHSAEYLERLLHLKLDPKEQRATGFQHDHQLINRELRIVEGTRKCAEFALDYQVAFNVAGGTHHAFSDKGEGFCLLNDQAVAIRWLQSNHFSQKILVVDLDVHQGNGTAEIFRDDESVFTFSMHGRHNYPLKKECSSRDVELEDGMEDEQYLDILDRELKSVWNSCQPDFVFYQSGVDVLRSDKLGRLSLSQDGCANRDRFVFEFFEERGVPVVCTMGGGYSPEIKDILSAHVNTFRIAAEVFT